MKNLKILIFSSFILLFVTAVYADEQVELLQKRVEELQGRVQELEAKQEQEQESKMPDYHKQNRGFWDPFEEADRMRKEMDRMFERSFPKNLNQNMWSQQTDFNTNFEVELKEEDDSYVIEYDISDLDKDKIDIDINEFSITISGSTSSETKEASSQRKFYSSSFGSFSKTIPLPTDADTSRLKTEKKEDLLIIVIPKRK